MKEVINEVGVDPFGSGRVSMEHPRVQYDAVYGNRVGVDVESVVDTAASGSIGINDAGSGTEYKASTGTSTTGFAYMQSRKAVRYRPGQGATIRSTGRFETALANSIQIVGGFNVGNSLGFGYNGTSFGIWHRAGGRPEIRTLTISAGAGGGENVTVTLNSAATVVAVTAGTVKHAVAQLAAGTYSGWRATSNGNTVVFVNTQIGAKAGTFSVTSTGTVAGTFARTAAGQGFVINNHIPQASWNNHKLNGSLSTDPFVLNPLKGNVYMIQFQYLGYGAMDFFVENPDTGSFLKVHSILNAGNVVGPTLDNPTLKVGLYVENAGNNTNITLYGASGAGFINGEVIPFRNPRGVLNTKVSVGTTYTSILAIRVMGVFGSKVNLAEVFPMLLGVSADGAKACEIILTLNPVLANEPDWTSIDATNSMVEYDITGTTLTGGASIIPTGLPKLGNENVDLEPYDIRLQAGDILCVAARAVSSTSDVTVHLSWIED